MKIGRMKKFLPFGAWRSLVARLPWAQEVPGSNPGAPTNVFDNLLAHSCRWQYVGDATAAWPVSLGVTLIARSASSAAVE